MVEYRMHWCSRCQKTQQVIVETKVRKANGQNFAHEVVTCNRCHTTISERLV